DFFKTLPPRGDVFQNFFPFLAEFVVEAQMLLGFHCRFAETVGRRPGKQAADWALANPSRSGRICRQLRLSRRPPPKPEFPERPHYPLCRTRQAIHLTVSSRETFFSDRLIGARVVGKHPSATFRK